MWVRKLENDLFFCNSFLFFVGWKGSDAILFNVTIIMKKVVSISLAVLLAMAGMIARAEIVSPVKAKEMADANMSMHEQWQGAGEADVRLVEENGTPAYYVVNYDNGGWAVISAQTAFQPLLAYNLTGEYSAPAPMQAVMKATACRIVDVSKLENSADHIAWEGAGMRRAAAKTYDYPDIEPLIVLNINQSEPFNQYCPTIGGEHVLVGCAAVSMGQAMMAARFPYAPQGHKEYVAPNVGFQEVRYDDEAPYDWDAMYNSKKTGNYEEVARLLYHCGVSIEMNYGLNGSGAYSFNQPTALTTYFGYDPELIQMYYKEKYEGDWLELILHDLSMGRVVIYSGVGDGGGHSWNIDGWSNLSQFVHVNWGWGGSGDGYFDIDNMSDSYQGLSFPDDVDLIVGVGSPSTAPYAVELSTLDFALGTPADVALADVKVFCEDDSAEYAFKLYGPVDIWGDNSESPYKIVDNKLLSTRTVEDTGDFRYLKLEVTNIHTDESYTTVFTINITAEGSVEAVLSDAMVVYPSVADNNITIEVPVVGGEYAIYSVSGAQVGTGVMSDYKTAIDVASYPAGTYILRYVHSNGVGVKTFVKK